MRKIIKEHDGKNTRVILYRSLIKGQFRFFIEVTDFKNDIVTKNEYLSEAMFEKFDEITFNYNFNELN